MKKTRQEEALIKAKIQLKKIKKGNELNNIKSCYWSAEPYLNGKQWNFEHLKLDKNEF